MLDPVTLISRLADAATGKTLQQLSWTGERGEMVKALIENERNIATTVVSVLRERASYDDHLGVTGESAVWEAFTSLFQNAGRQHEALLLSFSLYRSMLEAERKRNASVPDCRFIWRP